MMRGVWAFAQKKKAETCKNLNMEGGSEKNKIGERNFNFPPHHHLKWNSP